MAHGFLLCKIRLDILNLDLVGAGGFPPVLSGNCEIMAFSGVLY